MKTKANQAAFDVGQMAHRMAGGYYMHVAAIQVARDPRAVRLSPDVEPGHAVPIAYVPAKMALDMFLASHYLAQAGNNPNMWTS